MASLGMPANSESMVSSTTRRAPTCSTAWLSRTNKPFKIVLAGLVHLLPLDVHVVGGEQFPRFQVGQIKAQRRDVDAEIGDALVEGHEHAGFAVIDGAPDEKSGRQQRLAASGPPHTSVGLPAGRPPPVNSSSPSMPLGAFFKCSITDLPCKFAR